jgi:DNA mismatch endonuclease, patch repair protein
MADVLTAAQRSLCMSRIRSRDTTPELLVRRLAHGLGYRFVLHKPSLPGKPDLVFVARRKVIFVHGCFWHRHRCRFGRVMPGTRTEFWRSKLAGNAARDRRTQRQLRQLGWDILIIWECQTGDLRKLKQRLTAFLG